jgi:hypothetical protein
MRPSNGVNVILGARRSTSSVMRHVLARVRSVCCDECSRPIHWWNRRVWLVDGERCAHLRCFEGYLFLKALVEDEIRSAQLVVADQIQAPSRSYSEPSDNGSANDELRNSDASVTAMREPVERLEGQQQQTEEPTAKTRPDKNQRNGNSALHERELGQSLWHLLGRLAPHRPPRPPRLCMLCGGVEFSDTSVLCSKCGSPLRPWS